MTNIVTTPKISPKLGKYLFFLIVIGIVVFITYYTLSNKNKLKKTNIPDPKKPGTNPPVIPKTSKVKYNEATITALPDGEYPIVFGQKSKLVFLLQYALNVLNNDTLTLDGNFGKQTTASVVMQFGQNYVSKEDADQLLQYVSLSPDIDPFVLFTYQNLK